ATDRIRDYRSRCSVSDAVRRRRSTDNYLRYLVLNRMLDADLGMRSEQDRKTPLTALYRDRKSVYGLVGGRCSKTGAIQFPKSDVSVSQNDWTVGTQEDYPLAERLAKIVTFTEDYLAYTPDPPYAYGTIEFEGGGRMVAEFADYEPGALKVGADVRMQFRIKTVDANRGFASYFWKAVPIPTESSAEAADA
ncbi:MAG: OB-fold domain-containing protein, partial [Pseudomonadota bacterium]